MAPSMFGLALPGDLCNDSCHVTTKTLDFSMRFPPRFIYHVGDLSKFENAMGKAVGEDFGDLGAREVTGSVSAEI
jgi:hypothetical protein